MRSAAGWIFFWVAMDGFHQEVTWPQNHMACHLSWPPHTKLRYNCGNIEPTWLMTEQYPFLESKKVVSAIKGDFVVTWRHMKTKNSLNFSNFNSDSGWLPWNKSTQLNHIVQLKSFPAMPSTCWLHARGPISAHFRRGTLLPVFAFFILDSSQLHMIIYKLGPKYYLHINCKIIEWKWLRAVFLFT